MKYENFEGPVEELVRMKIKEIEENEHVRVLHVVESGSRAWGISSPDSDYDVRFIYAQEKDFYLSLRETKDTIDWELNEVLDINGWDVKKVLQHFHKSNSTVYEWSNSPVVYTPRKSGKMCIGRLQTPIFPASRLCINTMAWQTRPI